MSDDASDGASDGARDGAGPEALLAAVLAALRTGADEGAAALYAALTPRARAPLGGETGLRRALDNALLAPLVAASHVAVDPWDRRADAARTSVAVDGPNGPACYLVSARRSDAAWRLTGVRRDDLPPT